MDIKELVSYTSANRHPWELSRVDFFRKVTQRLIKPSEPMRVLDVGAGDLFVAKEILRELPSGSSIDCVDTSLNDSLIQKLNPPPGLSVFTAIPKSAVYDLIFLLDVVEHVEDDFGFLTQLKDNQLANGGRLIVSVPAYQSLYSSHDQWLGHFRRYSPKTGRALMERVGLKVLEEGPLFHGLVYVRALEKVRESLVGPPPAEGVSAWNKSNMVTELVHRALNSDWRLTEGFRKLGIRLPGLSWWCVCEKA